MVVRSTIASIPLPVNCLNARAGNNVSFHCSKISLTKTVCTHLCLSARKRENVAFAKGSNKVLPIVRPVFRSKRASADEEKGFDAAYDATNANKGLLQRLSTSNWNVTALAIAGNLNGANSYPATTGNVGPLLEARSQLPLRTWRARSTM
ncbi:MAG: hypothetical protein Q9191_007579 [Dirinaria sp. TL-2023a]